MTNEPTEKQRKAHDLGISLELQWRITIIDRPIVALPGDGQRVIFLNDPTDPDGAVRPDLYGPTFRLVGLLYDEAPAEGPNIPLISGELEAIRTHDPARFRSMLQKAPALQIWEAEVDPPGSRLRGTMRWRPDTGEEFSVLWKAGTIGRNDFVKVLRAFEALEHFLIRAQKPRKFTVADLEAAAIRVRAQGTMRSLSAFKALKQKDVARGLDEQATPSAREREVRRILRDDLGMTWQEWTQSMDDRPSVRIVR